MNFNLAEYVGKGLVKLIWLGASAAVAVQLIYVYKFVYVPSQWFTLSNEKSDWGTYGDFVGGLLNPYFSFLAFIAVVLTVVLQARQLDEMKKQAGLEEMQRVMSTVATRIDSLLAAPLALEPENFKPLDAPQSMFTFISLLGTWKIGEAASAKPLAGQIDWPKWMFNDVASKLSAVLDTETVAVRLEFEALAWMLSKYGAQDGNATVIDYHQYRYRAVLVWLNELGLLNSHHQIQAVFKPKESRKYMID
jgi:hypothetical protein